MPAWEAPSNLSDASTIAVNYNTTHDLSTPLRPWNNIPELTNVSGVGYYASRFSWLSSSGSALPCNGILGAYLKLDPILHIARVGIDGRRVPALDTQEPSVDVSQFLNRGENDILIVVPTTLWNYLRTILGELEDAGTAPGVTAASVGRFPVGLVGTPEIVPVLK
ncbi:hypothetical protein BX600DRAFT_431735 [Xylariales sp. PMI_506]|nr:hypothetical protein BX600DRAFT_431735 [Xylariales sp. PMI_506]